jgi:hypothetical protein
MFKCQIDVINATIDFLLSEDFNSAKTIDDLIDDCNIMLYQLYQANIDEPIYDHIKEIMSKELDKYI